MNIDVIEVKGNFKSDLYQLDSIKTNSVVSCQLVLFPQKLSKEV